MTENQTRMYYRLEMTTSDGTIHKARTWKRRRLLSKCKAVMWAEAKLAVVYYVNGVPVGENKGTYHKMGDLLNALEAFTESEVVS